MGVLIPSDTVSQVSREYNIVILILSKLSSVREEPQVQTFGNFGLGAWLISQWCEATIWGGGL